MLSAHQPYERYPELIRRIARDAGFTAQVAGGVPAMCDGVTQGQPGMELSLFSRDLIAMATAVALSHDMFDGALYLGICDKIVPGLLIAALSFGHLPGAFVPSGPDAQRHSQRAEIQGPPGVCRGQGRARGVARGRGRLVPHRRHLHLLRHRQLQPDADGDHGPAPARRQLRRRRTRRCAMRSLPPWWSVPGHAERAGRRLHAGRPHHRRARHHQRRDRPARHRRLHQPPAAPGGDRPRSRHPAAVGRFRRAFQRGAAAGAGLSERLRRREPVPRCRRHGLPDRPVARRRPAA